MKFMRAGRRSTDPVVPIAPLTDEEKREIADMDAAYNAHQDTRETVTKILDEIIRDERLNVKVDGESYYALIKYAKRIRKARDDT